jgi:hypothetical protein
MSIVAVGIDLAKNVFALHFVCASGKPELVKSDVKRNKLLELVASLPPCLIDMETCSGAHYWAREFQKFGHALRIIAPIGLKPNPSRWASLFRCAMMLQKPGTHNAIQSDFKTCCRSPCCACIHELNPFISV